MFLIARYAILASLLVLFPVKPLFEKSENIPADLLLTVSRQLSRPYLWFRSTASYLYIPFRKVQKRGEMATFQEMVKRGLWAEALILFCPYALSAGNLAILPRYLSYSLREKPYHHLHGNGATPEMERSFTLMNFNICFLPGELPLFFGGVSPPSDRVRGLAALIKKKNPDLVCLYEAHEVDSTYALYEKLKENYKHFYIDIGPEPLEFNSGLFVASKYDIIEPRFTPFQYEEMQEQINKGYFEFKLVYHDKILAHVYTTHLQPYRKEKDQDIREMELKEILENIASAHKERPNYPVILVGDLNISWGTEEYFASSLSNNFFSFYTKKISEVDESNRTATSYLTDLLWYDVDEKLLNKPGPSEYSEIIDYALIFDKQQNVDIVTTRVDAYNEELSTEALSDHHGLFSTITLDPGL